MNYELKFYYGQSPSDVQYLGSYKLHDLATFDHYRKLILHRMPFSVWFEHFDIESWHKNAIVDHTALTAEGTTDNGSTTAYFIVINDPSKLKFLTHEEFQDQNKINELINQLSKENITRYF